MKLWDLISYLRKNFFLFMSFYHLCTLLVATNLFWPCSFMVEQKIFSPKVSFGWHVHMGKCFECVDFSWQISSLFVWNVNFSHSDKQKDSSKTVTKLIFLHKGIKIALGYDIVICDEAKRNYKRQQSYFDSDKLIES